jgi:hypothetical protein
MDANEMPLFNSFVMIIITDEWPEAKAKLKIRPAIIKLNSCYN